MVPPCEPHQVKKNHKKNMFSWENFSICIFLGGKYVLLSLFIERQAWETNALTVGCQNVIGVRE